MAWKVAYLHWRSIQRDAWGRGWDDNQWQAMGLSDRQLSLKGLMVGGNADGLPGFPRLHVLQSCEDLESADLQFSSFQT